MKNQTPENTSDRIWTWIIGITAANGLMAIIYWLGVSLTELGSTQDQISIWLGLPSFFLLPLLGGLISAYFWKSLKPRVSQLLLPSFWITVVALVGSAYVFKEGVICLIIISPYFFGMIFAGACIGRVLFKERPPRLYVAVLPVLALAILVEPTLRTEEVGVVTDEIVIRASPEKIWPHLTAFPTIQAEPDFWLFKIGLPYPESTTNSGDQIGADRACIFSADAVFKETVTELVPNEKLTFDIVDIPKDPELLGHLTPHRGQFELRDNGDGTTTLVGSTWYTLHVRPLWYFDWWTHKIFCEVHLRVMEDIRRRSENP